MLYFLIFQAVSLVIAIGCSISNSKKDNDEYYDINL